MRAWQHRFAGENIRHWPWIRRHLSGRKSIVQRNISSVVSANNYRDSSGHCVARHYTRSCTLASRNWEKNRGMTGNCSTGARERICLVGSGNWGSVVAKIIGNNILRYGDQFYPDINMWVYEEEINGRKLTDIINTQHENVKYLPGIKLPSNVHAIPNVVEAAKDATVLVFVIPHQVSSYIPHRAYIRYNTNYPRPSLSLILASNWKESCILAFAPYR